MLFFKWLDAVSFILSLNLSRVQQRAVTVSLTSLRTLCVWSVVNFILQNTRVSVYSPNPLHIPMYVWCIRWCIHIHQQKKEDKIFVLLQESNLTARQPRRAPHHVIHLILQTTSPREWRTSQPYRDAEFASLTWTHQHQCTRCFPLYGPVLTAILLLLN